MLFIVNLEDKNSDRASIFTMWMQVKNQVILDIINSGSQSNLVSASMVKDLGLELEECISPYDINGKKREEIDQVTHK